MYWDTNAEMPFLADEQESIIDRYLKQRKEFAFEDLDVKVICVVTTKNFFTDNNNHQTIEEGILLKDMVYSKRNIPEKIV